jgi:hypothetical protein
MFERGESTDRMAVLIVPEVHSSVAEETTPTDCVDDRPEEDATGKEQVGPAVLVEPPDLRKEEGQTSVTSREANSPSLSPCECERKRCCMPEETREALEKSVVQGVTTTVQVLVHAALSRLETSIVSGIAGKMTAGMNGLKTELASLQGSVDHLTEEVLQQQSSIELLEAEKADLQRRVDDGAEREAEAEAEITSLNEELGIVRRELAQKEKDVERILKPDLGSSSSQRSSHSNGRESSGHRHRHTRERSETQPDRTDDRSARSHRDRHASTRSSDGKRRRSSLFPLG